MTWTVLRREWKLLLSGFERKLRVLDKFGAGAGVAAVNLKKVAKS